MEASGARVPPRPLLGRRRLPGAGDLRSPGRASSGLTATPGARSSSGAQTASRTAAATPKAGAIQPAESAAATWVGGGRSASRPACVGSEATATLSQAPAGVIQAGGPLIVGGSASAISWAPAVTQPPDAASAIGAGGAGGAPLSAAATDRLAPRSPGGVSARRDGGGQPASTFASVCTACAPLRMDAAPVMLATGAPTAQRPALRGPMDPSVPTAVATAETESPVPPRRGPAWPATLAGTGPTAGSHALWGCTERTAPSRAPATVSKERLANRRQDDAGTVRQDSRGPGGAVSLGPLHHQHQQQSESVWLLETGRKASKEKPCRAVGGKWPVGDLLLPQSGPCAFLACAPQVLHGFAAGVRPPVPRASLGRAAGPLAPTASTGAVILALGPASASLATGAPAATRPARKPPMAPIALRPVPAQGDPATPSLEPAHGKPRAGGLSSPASWGPSCSCSCWASSAAASAAVGQPLWSGAEQDLFPPMKHRLMAGLPSLPSSWPCFSRGGSKLPRVTVAHRDPEVPFNPSFIEPMSTACPWDSSFSSASEGANEEMGGCQEGPQSAPPPREALPEGSLLPSPFAIPRTSSLAKGKRPSVSFAEGTHFGPQSPRAPPEALNPTQKPCPASESSVQGAPPPQVNRPTGASCHSPGRSCYENVAPVPWEDSGWAPAGHHPGSSQHLAQRAGTPDSATVEACVHEPSITTIYVTVGQAGRGSEEPPPAAQQHQGSRQEAAAQPRSLQKLPWKALDAAKGTSRKLAPEKKPSTAEAQGLLAPDEQVDGGGSSGSLKL